MHPPPLPNKHHGPNVIQIKRLKFSQFIMENNNTVVNTIIINTIIIIVVSLTHKCHTWGLKIWTSTAALIRVNKWVTWCGTQSLNFLYMWSLHTPLINNFNFWYLHSYISEHDHQTSILILLNFISFTKSSHMHDNSYHACGQLLPWCSIQTVKRPCQGKFWQATWPKK